MPLTITEALAEIKTLDKRLAAKRQSILGGAVLARQEGLKDPITETGGSREFIRRERQAIGDLEARKVAIRMAIQQANHATPITVAGQTRTIAQWLTWRKEIAPGANSFLASIRSAVNANRQQALQKGLNVVTDSTSAKSMTDVIVNVDEADVLRDIEELDTILGTLDGQLSLKNATVLIDI